MASADAWSRRQALLGLAATLAAPAAAFASVPRGGLTDPEALDFSLRNATLVLPGGAQVKGGLRVVGGRIAAVGPEIDDGLDLEGDWLFPGAFDAGCTVGMVEVDQEGSSRDDRDSGPITADARAIDGYNPHSEVIPVTRLGGVTGALVVPHGGGLISGQAAAVQTAGDTLAECTLRAPAALLIRLGQGGDAGSRVGAMRQLREALEASPAPPTRERGHQRPFQNTVNEGNNVTERTLAAARRRELPVLVHAERADDIERALTLIDAYGLDAALWGGAEAWMHARTISEAGVPVVLSPVLAQPDHYGRLGARYDNAKLLHEAGVSLAFASGAAHFSRNLRVNVGVLTAHGLPWAAAIDGLCAGGPTILGLADVGRLAPGAHATFVRCSGDPLQPRTSVRGLWYKGRVASLRSRQTELKARYERLSGPAGR